jgi:hypothetical protein
MFLWATDGLSNSASVRIPRLYANVNSSQWYIGILADLSLDSKRDDPF